MSEPNATREKRACRRIPAFHDPGSKDGFHSVPDFRIKTGRGGTRPYLQEKARAACGCNTALFQFTLILVGSKEATAATSVASKFDPVNRLWLIFLASKISHGSLLLEPSNLAHHLRQLFAAGF